ncbi:MAG: PAS domain S-box protein [Spirochaetes bacterium]|nr:PAS domain S-box protein [Spirochaetota bacterium]
MKNNVPLKRRIKQPIKLKISSKVVLSFIILVILQGAISLFTLTTIISHSQNDAFTSQINRANSSINGYMNETLNKLINNTTLLAGQKKVIDYTDFGLKNLCKRELTIYRSTLQTNSLAIYVKPDILFTSVGSVPIITENFKSRLKLAFAGRKPFFIITNGNNIEIIILSPIKRENKVIGVLSLGLNLDPAFVKELENIIDAKVIFRFNNKIIQSGTISSKTVSNILKIDSKTPITSEIVHIDGYVIGSFYLSSLGYSGGRFFCLLDTKQSRRLIQRYNLISVISTLIILSFALFIAIIFYRVSFYRPFQNLLKGVHQISAGDFHYHFQVPADDEFGELASAFNRMRGNLINHEKELLQLSNYNNLILENVRSGIITIDLENRIISYNPAAERILHIDLDKYRGNGPDKKRLPVNLSDMLKKTSREEPHITGREIRTGPNGNEQILSMSTSPLISKEGEKLGVIVIFEDITKIKKLEEKLILSSRLAALGEMAAGVAHQIRNPLGIMKVSAEMLRDNYSVIKKQESFTKITHMLINEIDTLNLVIRNLLDFSRPREIQTTLYPIQKVIRQSLNSLPLDKYPKFQITIDIEKDIADYPMDSSMMEQVISNLILNGIQASDEEGKIEIRVFMQNEHMHIEIRDRGHGIDDKNKEHIFNPFFTTKATGTGLGLSIVHRIIEQHNGTIDVVSEPGKGSAFIIVF